MAHPLIETHREQQLLSAYKRATSASYLIFDIPLSNIGWPLVATIPYAHTLAPTWYQKLLPSTYGKGNDFRCWTWWV